MTRTPGGTAPAFVALLLLFLAACGSDGGGGSSVCERVCDWKDACEVRDSPGPAPLGFAPDPIGERDDGGASTCVDECQADWDADACIRSTLPDCTACREFNGCTDDACDESCDRVEACLGRTPLDPPTSEQP